MVVFMLELTESHGHVLVELHPRLSTPTFLDSTEAAPQVCSGVENPSSLTAGALFFALFTGIFAADFSPSSAFFTVVDYGSILSAELISMSAGINLSLW